MFDYRSAGDLSFLPLSSVVLIRQTVFLQNLEEAGKRSEEGEQMEGLSLPHKLLDPMAKADFDGFWVRVEE